MSTIDSNALLAQMRLMAARAQSLPATPAVTSEEKGRPEFSAMLQNAVRQVNEQQLTAQTLATRFEQGDQNVDVAQVMVAMQKANLSFQAVTQVRNRLVSAYQDIMNMPV